MLDRIDLNALLTDLPAPWDSSPATNRRAQRLCGKYVLTQPNASSSSLNLYDVLESVLAPVTYRRRALVFRPGDIIREVHNFIYYSRFDTSLTIVQRGLSKAKAESLAFSVVRFYTARGMVLVFRCERQVDENGLGFVHGISKTVWNTAHPLSLVCDQLRVTNAVPVDTLSHMLHLLYKNPLDVTTWSAMHDYVIDNRETLGDYWQGKAYRNHQRTFCIRPERLADAAKKAAAIYDTLYTENDIHLRWLLRVGDKVTLRAPVHDICPGTIGYVVAIQPKSEIVTQDNRASGKPSEHDAVRYDNDTHHVKVLFFPHEHSRDVPSYPVHLHFSNIRLLEKIDQEVSC